MNQTVASWACQSSSCVCQNAGKKARDKRTSCSATGSPIPAREPPVPPRRPPTLTRWSPILARGPPISVSGLLTSTRGSPYFCICQMASYVGQRASCILRWATCAGERGSCIVEGQHVPARWPPVLSRVSPVSASAKGTLASTRGIPISARRPPESDMVLPCQPKGLSRGSPMSTRGHLCRSNRGPPTSAGGTSVLA